MIRRPRPRRPSIALSRASRFVAALAVSLSLAGCGGGGAGNEAAPTQPETPADGEPVAGADVFAENGCGSCHTFAAADSSGAVGPNLDETLERDARAAGQRLPDFVRASIVDPDAFVAPGFDPGVMPQTFDDSLDERELEALVEFLSER